MNIYSMFPLKFMILVCCCGGMYERAIFKDPKTIHAEFSMSPWSATLVNTPNYDLPKHYSSFNDSISVDKPVDYFLNESLIFTYSFTNKDKLGTITVIFKEFYFDPGSLIYIYDGSDVSAPGSLWTYDSDVPVYSSTGPHVFMVFKTGKLLCFKGTHRNVGFVAVVNALAQGDT